jgi:vanillate/3-O-methylgallate O-demethylase
MEAVTDDSIRDIGFMNYRQIDIAGHDVYALRHGMGGEPGLELHLPRAGGDEIWAAIAEAGEDHGLVELPMQSLPLVLPLVTGLPQAGFDYIPAVFGDDMQGYREWLDADPFANVFAIEGSYDADDISDYYRSPIEYGWTYIDFDHDFVGRDALQAELDDPQRTLVTLEWNADDILDVMGSFFESGPHYKFIEMPQKASFTVRSDAVLKDGDLVGSTTNRAYYYTARTMLSLATVDIDLAEPGTELTVVWGESEEVDRHPIVEEHDRQKEIRATVVPTPYKQDNRAEGVEGERQAETQ